MNFLSRALQELRPNSNWYAEKDLSYKNIKWVDPPEVSTKPTEEEINAKIEQLVKEEPMRVLKLERDRLLLETDWWVLPDRTPTEEQLKYRQDLRDLPKNSNPVLDLNNPPLGISGVDWPIKPK